MLDHKQTIQQPESDHRYGEEIKRYDDFAMILEKGQPTSLGIATPLESPQIASHRSLRDLESQPLQFAVDLGSAPTGIFFCQAPNQFSEFRGDSRSSPTPARFPVPVPAESGPMPGNHGVWLTTISTFFHPDQNRRSKTQNSRSAEFSGGRGRFRLSTVTCCLRARISRARSARVRKKARSPASTANMKSNTELPLYHR